MRKANTALSLLTALLLATALLGLTSCEGSYIDPGAMEMMSGGYGLGGLFGDDGGSGGKGKGSSSSSGPQELTFQWGEVIIRFGDYNDDVDLVYDVSDPDGIMVFVQDFTVIIDGNSVISYSGFGTAGPTINLSVTGKYNKDQEYTVKVVYTANSSRQILLNGKTLKSFTIEKKCKYYTW